MKNQLIYTICAILLLTIAVVGGTYAYFSSSANSAQNLNSNSMNFEVIYTGGTDISGNMPITDDKTEAFKTTVNIKVGEGSANALSTLFINIEEMTSNLSIKGFIWEVYGYKNSKLVYSDNGTFEGYSAAEGHNILEIVKDYRLTEENTSFTLYLWVDGNQTDNNVLGATFKGYIGARTEQFTGKL